MSASVIGGYLVERVRVEELDAWRRRHGLVVEGRATLGDGEDWPPVVLYRRVKDLQKEDRDV